MLNQCDQSFNGLRRQREGLPIAEKKQIRHVNAKGTKLVEMPCGVRHRRLEKQLRGN
jgi:hypothetical protein